MIDDVARTLSLLSARYTLALEVYDHISASADGAVLFWSYIGHIGGFSLMIMGCDVPFIGLIGIIVRWNKSGVGGA